MHLVLAIILIVSLVYMMIPTFALPRVNNTGSNAITVTLNISNYSYSGRGNATQGYIIQEDANYIFNFSINYTSVDGAAQENLTDINVTLVGPGLTYVVTTAESGLGQFGANFSKLFTGGRAEEGNGSDFNNWTRSNLTDTNGYTVIIWNGTNATSTLVFMDRNATGQTVGLNYSTIWFNASASTPGLYNITIRFFANNSVGGMGNETNFTIIVNDTTAPSIVNFTTDGEIATTSYANVSGSIVVNMSVVDNGNYSLTMGTTAREINYVNVTVWNSTGGQLNHTYSASNLSAFAWNGNYWNVTINTSQFPDGVYNISISANDSQGNSNSTNISLITFDNTAPTASVVCSPSTSHTGETVTCTCSPSDSLSGVNSSATSVTTNPSTSSTGTFSQSCSFADMAGNGASASATYIIEQSGSGSSSQVPVTKSSSTTTTTTTTPTETASTKASHTFDLIMPGTPAVQTDFNADAGLKEISIEVNGEAKNVEVTVTKHDAKPKGVSPDVPGTVYKYLQVETQNLTDKLSKATLTFQVEKTWVSDNGLAKENVSVFKFDDGDSSWNELSTAYSNEDNTFYYYTADVSSFSYFAIGEKAVVAQPATAKSGKTWVWIILTLAVLGVVAWYVFNRKK